jgi:hypothetical protein
MIDPLLLAVVKVLTFQGDEPLTNAADSLHDEVDLQYLGHELWSGFQTRRTGAVEWSSNGRDLDEHGGGRTFTLSPGGRCGEPWADPSPLSLSGSGGGSLRSIAILFAITLCFAVSFESFFEYWGLMQ